MIAYLETIRIWALAAADVVFLIALVLGAIEGFEGPAEATKTRWWKWFSAGFALAVVGLTAAFIQIFITP